MSPLLTPHSLGFFMQNSANAASQIPAWLPVVASIIGGGAMGAIITAVITNYRNRRQSIAYVLMYEPFLPKDVEHLPIEFREQLTEESKIISSAVLLFTNTSNQDLAEFPFGITLPSECRLESVIFSSKDRHHVVTFDKSLLPTPELDLILKPLNRKEPCVIIRMLISHPSNVVEPKITVSTSHSARLVEVFVIDPKTGGVL
jgi:hypothetical protein